MNLDKTYISQPMHPSKDRDPLEILAACEEAKITDNQHLVLSIDAIEQKWWRRPDERRRESDVCPIELIKDLSAIRSILYKSDPLKGSQMSPFYEIAIKDLSREAPLEKRFRYGLFPLHPEPAEVRNNLKKMAAQVIKGLEQENSDTREVDEGRTEIREKAESALFHGMRMIFTENVKYLRDEAQLFPRNLLQQKAEREDNYLTLKEIRTGVEKMSQVLKKARKQLVDPEFLLAVKEKLKITAEESFEALTTHEQDAILNHLEDEAFLQFLQDLGMISGKSYEYIERRKESIISIFNEATNDAWKEYEKIGNSVAEAMKKMKIPGKRPKIKASGRNRSRRLPELLCFAFDKGEKNKRAQQEAQVVSHYSFSFAMAEMNPLYKLAMKRYQKIAGRCLKSILKDPDDFEEVSVPMDRGGNFLASSGEDDTCETIKLRILKNPIVLETENEIRRIIIDPVEVKPKASIVEKMLDKGDVHVQEIGDLIRARIALEGINSEEFDRNSQIKSWCVETLQDIGSKNGLQETRKHDRKDLKPGEFLIEEDEKECSENGNSNNDQDGTPNKHSHQYPYIKLCALLDDGLSLEIQIIPWDTYHRINSPDSPSSSERYKQRKLWKLALLQHPQSQYPDLHEAAHRVIEADRAARGKK